MNTEQYTYLLEHPTDITASNTSELRAIIDAFPFFQSAHALYLKGLKNQGSFSYNKALKRTAAHTTDRSVIFEYITSNQFTQNDVSTLIKEQEHRLREIKITGLQDVSTQLEAEEQEKASKILDPDLFIEKEDSIMTSTSAKETLKVGTPLPFTKSEGHSFGEWLKLAAFKPIDRSDQKIAPEVTQENRSAENSVENTSAAKAKNKAVLQKKRKQEIVDSFIETNPKITITPPTKGEKITPTETPSFSSDTLMTETLARVYVEQKNYKKAKQAFRILSLKYPEKSGFFADQIRAVTQLEEQKE